MRSTSAAWAVFDLVRRPWMAARLRVHLAGVPDGLPSRGPVLLVSNHESFYDGFLLRDVQRAVRPGASFHAVMLEREMAGRPWLRALGAVGAVPGSVAAGRRLLRAVDALPDDAVLGFLPQGRIRPGSPRPLRFRAGVETVRDRLDPAAVLPVALRLTGGRTPRTEAYVSVGAPVRFEAAGVQDLRVLEDAVTAQVDAVDAFLAEHGEDAPDAWPGPGGRLDGAPPPWLLDAHEPWLSRN